MYVIVMNMTQRKTGVGWRAGRSRVGTIVIGPALIMSVYGQKTTVVGGVGLPSVVLRSTHGLRHHVHSGSKLVYQIAILQIMCVCPS